MKVYKKVAFTEEKEKPITSRSAAIYRHNERKNIEGDKDEEEDEDEEEEEEEEQFVTSSNVQQQHTCTRITVIRECCINLLISCMLGISLFIFSLEIISKFLSQFDGETNANKSNIQGMLETIKNSTSILNATFNQFNHIAMKNLPNTPFFPPT